MTAISARAKDDVVAEPGWWVWLRDTYRGRLNTLCGGVLSGNLAVALGTLIQVVELHQPRVGIRYKRYLSTGDYATQHWWCPVCCDSRCFEAPGDSHVREVPDCCDTLQVAIENLYVGAQDLPPVLERALRQPRPGPRLVDSGGEFDQGGVWPSGITVVFGTTETSEG